MEKPKVVLLLSGGFDSPVAGYLLQKEGFEITALNFSQEPFVDKSHALKAKEISEVLTFQRYLTINIGKELLEISEKAKHSYYFILMKRLMYKLATRVANYYDCSFIASGESIAQVSSQTLNNLIALEESTIIPILRPLVSYSKNEIINIAKIIGTYDISKGPESCDKLGPKYPIINADIINCGNEEKKVPIQNMINKIMENFRPHLIK